jgi:transcriptional regulator with GAF, ATPase, and Fis domain
VDAKLVVVAGPLKQSEYSLSEEEVWIGRDPGNLISIADPSLSRRHCVILREGDRLKIRDLESLNGTYVNGAMIQEAWLEAGDQISIGDCELVLRSKDEPPEHVSGTVEFDDILTRATANLAPQDIVYSNPDRILSELPSAPRLAHNLTALLKISDAVHAIRDLEELQNRILDLIFENVPAERGAILMDYTGNGQFGSVFARHHTPNRTEPIRISRTISREVQEQGTAILGADVPGSSDFNLMESVVASSVRSLMCVPLMVFDSVIGCLYLDTITLGRFDEDHLQLVAAIAGISAIALDNARRLQWLEEENQRLLSGATLEHSMVGSSSPMKQVYDFVVRVARSEATVLIEGESGTGKELAAKAIYHNSPRATKPFVAINCAAIPEGLLESELFGHEKGAFTGALAQKKGRLELANGGVVFLDEIGELAPALQVKLLRVLQEREFERLGGNHPISVDIRLIAATNKDLKEEVEKGNFRQDLYYRLNVVSLLMPPLRERRDDIPMLAEYFVAHCSKDAGVTPKRISPEAMTCLLRYDWPGNVRELENAIERALVLSNSETLRPEDLPDAVVAKQSPILGSTTKYHAALKNVKRQLILAALKRANGNYTEAARALGVHPNYLHRLIRNLGLKDAIRSGPKFPHLPSSAA